MRGSASAGVESAVVPGAGSGRGSFYAEVTGWCPFMPSCACTGAGRAIVGVMKHCFMFSFHGNSPQPGLVEGFTVSGGYSRLCVSSVVGVVRLDAHHASLGVVGGGVFSL